MLGRSVSRLAALNNVSEAVARVWVRVVALERNRAGGEPLGGDDNAVAAQILDLGVDPALIDQVLRALPADGGADVRARALRWLGDVELVCRAWPPASSRKLPAVAPVRVVLHELEWFAEGTLLSVLARRNGVDEAGFRAWLAQQTRQADHIDAEPPTSSGLPGSPKARGRSHAALGVDLVKALQRNGCNTAEVAREHGVAEVTVWGRAWRLLHNEPLWRDLLVVRAVQWCGGEVAPAAVLCGLPPITVWRIAWAELSRSRRWARHLADQYPEEREPLPP